MSAATLSTKIEHHKAVVAERRAASRRASDASDLGGWFAANMATREELDSAWSVYSHECEDLTECEMKASYLAESRLVEDYSPAIEEIGL